MHAAAKPESVPLAVFRAIDAMDAEKFVSFLTEDAEFRFGSAPAVLGKAAIVEGVQTFFASIAGLSHRVARVWQDGASLACEGEVCYQRHNGSEIVIPVVDVFEYRGESISRYLIYIDIGPLYAE